MLLTSPLIQLTRKVGKGALHTSDHFSLYGTFFELILFYSGNLFTFLGTYFAAKVPWLNK